MKLIQLKFSDRMTDLITFGKKSATCRREQKGNAGDIFLVENRVYRITQVNQIFCADACDLFYEAEGFTEPEEMITALKEFYPGITSSDLLYIHHFAFWEYTFGDCDFCPLDELHPCPFDDSSCPGIDHPVR